MKVLDDGRIQCRVKIIGTFCGEPFEFIDPEDSKGSQFIWPDGDPSTYWWTDGNFSCDCNRAQFIGKKIGDVECGETINIDKIIPIDFEAKTLELNESKVEEDRQRWLSYLGISDPDLED